MSQDKNPNSSINEAQIPANSVEDVRVEDEMEQSYIDYAMSVIAGRALPDVRDGLKPVHRRILYAMLEMGVGPSSAHRKSSSVVGETMGDYHPHGDSAIYDALARMSQDFSMRYPLVDGQGNFGSIDDDPPAAMRYTEARMSQIGNELSRDIDMDTVDFKSNYDDRLTEPEVFPAPYPNLLVNGGSGIAVGMSTKIPPHNLNEVIDATVHLIENKDATVEDLMEHVNGPDFPTGAKIVGTEGIENAYKTGRGRIKMRASIEIDEDENQIIVSEIPYQENKSRLIEKIADSINEGRIEGVSDLRDESDKDGIRIVIELKRDTIPEIVRNKLLEHHLEKGFSVINLALVDGQPQVLDLKQTLGHYIDHRRDVVRRRSQHELDEAQDRAHILEGRLVALDNVDDVVETIQDSTDRDDAKDELSELLDLSDEQVDHIVRMQLGSLTSMEEGDIRDEYDSVTSRIERLNTILDNEAELMQVVKDELLDVKERYGDARRTEIVPDKARMSQEDLIKQEDVYVILTDEGYVKRMTIDTISPQNRGGKGVIGVRPKTGDFVRSVQQLNTHDTLLLLSSTGDVHRLRGYNIPEKSRQSRGTPIQQYLDLDDGEFITAICSVSDFDEAREQGDDLVLMTEHGLIKRTSLSEFSNIHSSGIRAISLDENDTVLEAEVLDDEAFCIMAGTRQGKAIRFSTDDVRPTGRTSRGVNAMSLADGDRISSVNLVRDIGEGEETLLTVTENGYGKRTNVYEYREQSRYGKGVLDIKTDERNGETVTSKIVNSDDHAIIMTKGGNIIRTPVNQISTVSRNTKGVKVAELSDGDEVASVTTYTPEQSQENSE